MEKTKLIMEKSRHVEHEMHKLYLVNDEKHILIAIAASLAGLQNMLFMIIRELEKEGKF